MVPPLVSKLEAYISYECALFHKFMARTSSDTVCVVNALSILTRMFLSRSITKWRNQQYINVCFTQSVICTWEMCNTVFMRQAPPSMYVKYVQFSAIVLQLKPSVGQLYFIVATYSLCYILPVCIICSVFYPYSINSRSRPPYTVLTAPGE